MSEAQVQELLDRFAIMELKHRYFRTVDEKDWHGLRATFTSDVTFDFGDGRIMHGPDAFVDWVESQLRNATSVHRGTLPELFFDSQTAAHGWWALDDYIEWPPDPETGERCGYRGYGREYEHYRKVDGEWRIAAWRLQYDRTDPLPRQPLPETIQHGLS